MIRFSPTTPMLAAALALATAISPAVAMPLSSGQALSAAKIEGPPRLLKLASTSTRQSVRQVRRQPTPADIRSRQIAKAHGHHLPAQGRPVATAEFQGQHLVQLSAADLWRPDMERVQPITEQEIAAYQSKLAEARARAERACGARKSCISKLDELPLPEPDVPDAQSLSYRQAGVRAAMIKHAAVARRPDWWGDMLERAEALPPAQQLAVVDGMINTNTRYADRPGGPWSRTPAEQDKMGALCRDSAVAKMLALQELDPIRWNDSNLRIVTLAPRPLASADGALSAAHVVLVARLGASETFVLDILKADRANPAGQPYAMKVSPQAGRGVLWAGTATASSESWGRGRAVARKAADVREAGE